ncbi:hypothetical protein Q7P37_010606 [Cladosporium fusiforme]
MAGSREPAFTNDEKVAGTIDDPMALQTATDNRQNYMLAEIIKSVSPSPSTLLNLVMQLGAHQPRWDDMPLPPGRSVNACRAAFEDLKRSAGYSPLSQSTAPQTPLSAPIGPLRRPWQLETSSSYPVNPPGRQLLPKAKTEGQAGVMVLPQPSATPGVQAKRKRGRPTKAEAQAKAAESSAASSVAGASARRESAATPRAAVPGPSAAPSPALASASAPPTSATPNVETKPSIPSTSRVPISAMITTPTTQQTSSHSGSSSGKRRRRKSMRSELDEPRETQYDPVAQNQSQPQPQQQQQSQQQPQQQPFQYPHYESPYSRIELDDTPARSTGMRHYDDPLPGRPPGLRLPQANFPGSRPPSGPPSGGSQGQGPSLPPSR